jgi:TRAP-type mannitol/chloroaromatic compound transport system permease small subunit
MLTIYVAWKYVPMAQHNINISVKAQIKIIVDIFINVFFFLSFFFLFFLKVQSVSAKVQDAESSSTPVEEPPPNRVKRFFKKYFCQG